MVNLLGRELKFFFTSPLFISLELAPVISITALNITGLPGIQEKLLSVVWLAIIFYSTYFELELWRKTFLSKSFKLRVYSSISPYVPFLIHCVVSLVLLELKTLVFILYVLRKQSFLNYLLNLPMFLITTHINWLFSLSIGAILSKEVFNKTSDSATNFLCILIFSLITLLIEGSPLAQHWPAPTLSSSNAPSEPVTVGIPISLVLFAMAVYANSSISKRLLLEIPE